MIESQQVYKSLSISTTSNGVLWTQSSVNPTKSLKNIVTQSKFSASTFSPRFSDSATVLFQRRNFYTTCIEQLIRVSITHIGSILKRSVSVFFFSSYSKLVRSWTNPSRLYAYFSIIANILSKMFGFLKQIRLSKTLYIN